jgi:voltage-gated potassium channel Kch
MQTQDRSSIRDPETKNRTRLAIRILEKLYEQNTLPLEWIIKATDADWVEVAREAGAKQPDYLPGSATRTLVFELAQHREGVSL